MLRQKYYEGVPIIITGGKNFCFCEFFRKKHLTCIDN